MSDPTKARSDKTRRRRRQKPGSANTPRDKSRRDSDAQSGTQPELSETDNQTKAPSTPNGLRPPRRKRRAKPGRPPDINLSKISVPELVKQGDAARQRRHIKQALDAYTAALQRSPDDIRARSGIAFTLLDLDEFEQALEHLEHALDHGGEKTGSILVGMAVALLNLERYSAALEYAYRLAEIPGRRHEAKFHSLAGRIHFEQGQFVDAAEHLEQRLQIEDREGKKGLRRDRYLLAEIYAQLNRPSDALPILEDILSDNWSRSIQDQVGRLYLQLERWPDAERTFNKILKQFPNDERALTGRGKALLRSNGRVELWPLLFNGVLVFVHRELPDGRQLVRQRGHEGLGLS